MMFSFKKSYCQGKCCNEAVRFIEYDGDFPGWFAQDNGGNYVVRIYYCSFCGKPLGFDETTIPIRQVEVELVTA